MTRIEVSDGRLRVEVLGWDKLWAFKGGFDLPAEHVVGARPWDPVLDAKWKGIRAPGTAWPGLIVAGTYHRGGEHVFYDVHDFEGAIVIELRHEWYARLIVEVEEPEAVLGFFRKHWAVA